METLPGHLPEHIDRPKTRLPAARIRAIFSQDHHPESTQLARCHLRYLMLSSQGDRDHQVTNSPAYHHQSFCHVQLEHGTGLSLSVRSLQDPSLYQDEFPSNLSLTKRIKRTRWASVSFLLVVLDDKNWRSISSFGPYCVN